MSMTATAMATWTRPAASRLPWRGPEGGVIGYTAQVTTPPGQPLSAQVADLIEAEYGRLDLDQLAGGLPLALHGTPRLLTGGLQRHTSAVTLALPAWLAEVDGVLERARVAHENGQSLGLADYAGHEAQDRLLGLADLVLLRPGLPGADLGALVERAHAAGARAVAPAHGVADVTAAFAAGADAVAGPLVEPDAPRDQTFLAAGQLQCLHLLQLLGEDPIDQAAVVGLVAAEPTLALRVLRLVNSSAVGLSRTVDSVRQAVVLVGPRRLRALASASLADAGASTLHELWATLTRAVTCWELTGDDVGYTVGLLSSVADQRHVSLPYLAERAGLGAQVSAALTEKAGPVGAVLRAVEAHEQDDPDAVLAAGYDPHVLSRTWLAALPEAYAIAEALAVDAG